MAREIRFFSRTDRYSEFSNFAAFGFEIDGQHWPTVEHYFQARKFSDAEHIERIRSAGSPKQAKSLGRSRKFPIREDWDDERDVAMLEAVRAKFMSHPDLRDLLVSTGKRRLVEASPFDSYWGEGRNGRGRNRLGEILMQVREELQAAK
jgi:ribA/ribD-fused uncharacterized protein